MYITPYQNNQVVKDILFKDALEALSSSAELEKEDEVFYDYLITIAPTQEAKEILTTIRNDERRHNSFIKQIYKDITGTILEIGEETSFKRPSTYEEGLKRALFSELEAVDRYRKIRSGISGTSYQEALFEIITDELIHASKYNYLMYISGNSQVNNGIGTGGTIIGGGTTGGTGTSGTTTGGGMTGGTGASGKTTGGSIAIGNEISSNMGRNTIDDKGDSSAEHWLTTIAPLVVRAQTEANGGENLQHLFQFYILVGVLVGLGKKSEDALEQVEKWYATDESQLLYSSKTVRGYIY